MSCAASRISKSPARTPIDELDPWQSPRPGTTSIPPKRPYMFWVQGQSPPKHPTKYSTSPTRHNGNRKFPEKDTGTTVAVDTGYGFTSTVNSISLAWPSRFDSPAQLAAIRLGLYPTRADLESWQHYRGPEQILLSSELTPKAPPQYPGVSAVFHILLVTFSLSALLPLADMNSIKTETTSSLPNGYIDIQDHALIGNLRTAALISVDGTVESYCIPHFDSPSVFARILDANKGGHFSIRPVEKANPKQGYLPSSNVLSTKFLNEKGVANVIDYLPLDSKYTSARPFLPWLIRRVEVTRGTLRMRLEIAPAFNYCRDPHDTTIVRDDSVLQPQDKVVFKSKDLQLDLRVLPLALISDSGPSQAEFDLTEGQAVTFILRTPPPPNKVPPRPTAVQAEQAGVPYDVLLKGVSKMRLRDDPVLSKDLVTSLLTATTLFWRSWIGKSTYKGAWREAVHRSALALKLLIFEPTGAIVASPTFSLPEHIGGTRNWDYRFSWIRDSSFTLYALIRLGFTEEATAFTEFIFDRLKHKVSSNFLFKDDIDLESPNLKNPDGSLQIMYTIHGEKDLEEIELTHLEGHKKSQPVRIGYKFETCEFLVQSASAPWLKFYSPRVDYVVANYHRQDLYAPPSAGFRVFNLTVIHLDRSGKSGANNGTSRLYSKVMMWVAIDRGLRLAEKRSLPCPHRQQWYAARDSLYEEIMEKAWNAEKGFFCQSYEDKDVLDSAVLVMPLVFFCAAGEPRFLSTLNAILKSPERGGLLANNLVYRYDASQVDDGVGGEEAVSLIPFRYGSSREVSPRISSPAFSLCTLWAVEALTRAGDTDRAVSIFEEFLDYGNHTGLFSEEWVVSTFDWYRMVWTHHSFDHAFCRISSAGEGLGNAVQGFTHVTLISAAFNLSRTLNQMDTQIN
ncbi:glycoside hydrolase family 15 protein [Hydnum rufescens UP504]|uniref:Glycoside hydrolase family 15 protein n=1 Tax=Hydnum rufescens UP504 TaxID=1448309 RepID=A0A9P6ASX9_9AGAM|nr:glycoside hydrolase family 15 protein [Hydnum rufescens UP504]